jgi:hypothetical protein
VKKAERRKTLKAGKLEGVTAWRLEPQGVKASRLESVKARVREGLKVRMLECLDA